jgi:hypothetical protein
LVPDALAHAAGRDELRPARENAAGVAIAIDVADPRRFDPAAGLHDARQRFAHISSGRRMRGRANAALPQPLTWLSVNKASAR